MVIVRKHYGPRQPARYQGRQTPIAVAGPQRAQRDWDTRHLKRFQAPAASTSCGCSSSMMIELHHGRFVSTCSRQQLLPTSTSTSSMVKSSSATHESSPRTAHSRRRGLKFRRLQCGRTNHSLCLLDPSFERHELGKAHGHRHHRGRVVRRDIHGGSRRTRAAMRDVHGLCSAVKTDGGEGLRGCISLVDQQACASLVSWKRS